MDYFYLTPLLIPIALLIYRASRRSKCPDCGSPLSMSTLFSRTTPRIRRVGGYLCRQCSCETDLAGRKVPFGTPLPSFAWRYRIAAGVLCVSGFGMLAAMKYAVPILLGSPK